MALVEIVETFDQLRATLVVVEFSLNETLVVAKDIHDVHCNHDVVERPFGLRRGDRHGLVPLGLQRRNVGCKFHHAPLPVFDRVPDFFRIARC